MFEKLRHNLNSLSRDARESILLRCRLAMIEVKADLRNVRGLAVVLAIAVVGILTGISVLAVWGAQLLNRYVPLPADLWTMILGVGVIVVAILLALVSWFRFRRRWVGLEQTLEELHEDLAWLKEWAGKE